jgi:hypothetical protein
MTTCHPNMTMSTDLHCITPSGEFLLDNHLWPWGRLPAKDSISPDDPAQRFWDKILLVEKCVADTLFETATPTSLDAALEMLLDDPSYRRFQRELRAMITFEMVERTAIQSSSAPRRLLDGAGRSLAHRVKRANQLMSAAGSAVLQILGWLAKRHVTSGEDDDGEPAAPSDAGPHADAMNFLYDPELPPTVKEILLKREIADACMFAIGAANDRGVLPWMKEALLDRWIDGLEGYVAFLAGHSAVDLPDDIVSKDKQLELGAILLRHTDARVKYESSLEQARASGEDVFPPLAHIDG